MSDTPLPTQDSAPFLYRWWHRVISAPPKGPSISRGLLSALSGLYRLGLKANLAIYGWGLKGQTEPVLPTISVGNLTLGGTGKTTVVQFLARRLSQEGLLPAIVLRGYRRASPSVAALISDEQGLLVSVAEAGDEAYMLANSLAAVPVAVGKRRETAIKLLADHTSAQVVLLDDGFQYFRMSKLIDIVLVDATQSLADQRLFPAGRLREPLSHLRRADQVWITHADQATSDQLDALRRLLATAVPPIPLVVTIHQLSSLSSLAGEIATLKELAGARVLAVSGIGNPQSFEASLQQAGAQVVPLRYPDHHAYSAADMQHIQQVARHHNAEMIVCTSKDAVKWPQMDWPVPVAEVGCQLSVIEGESHINRIVEKVREKVTAADND